MNHKVSLELGKNFKIIILFFYFLIIMDFIKSCSLAELFGNFKRR